ncbi:MAG TPA: tyrosine--tRNA ligase [Myxococcales bacterium]|nr:tyrosine--tRNA ligase [Myxococcales bacterium]HAN31206.1 tyrosine--tRNA ligase [Myxococcales bacterium]
MTKTSLYDELKWRGLIHQVTDEPVAREALAGRTAAYIGFDPTSTSLHVGSLLQIMNLVRLQRAGHRAVALVGGGTGLIGDPSGKSAERTLLTDDRVRANAEALHGVLSRFLDFDGDNPAVMVNNLDWLGDLGLLPFLRDVGKHFSVNAMVQRDSVRTRLDERNQGISYTEFSYMLLQAFDFAALYREHGCQAQLGGSDQWGNMVSGIDLIRRSGVSELGQPFALTSPLITSKSGKKFGKTEDGAVWLDADRTSPYAFYQFWLQVSDDDVADYLRYFTLLDQQSIEDNVQEHLQAPHKRHSQRLLAQEVTRFVHGAAGLEQAQRATEVLFTGQVQGVPAEVLTEIFAHVPSASISRETLGTQGVRCLLVGEAQGFAFTSNSDAKRALKQGSISVNGVRLGADPNAEFSDLIDNQLAVVRVGKKRYFLVKVI